MAEKDLGQIIRAALEGHPRLDVLARRDEPALPEAECCWGAGINARDEELCFSEATVWIEGAGYCDAHAETVLKDLG